MIHLFSVAHLVLLAVLLFLVPQLTPRYALFGVRIRPEFRSSPIALRAIAMFRLAVLLGFALALLLVLGFPISRGSVIAPPLVLMLAAGAAWAMQYRRLKPLASMPEVSSIQIELSNEIDRLPRYFWFCAVPFVLFAICALYLHTNWAHIPARFPVHWGADGQPNRWAERSTRGVYGSLLFGSLLNAWFVILALSIWYGARRSHYREATVQVLVTVQFLMCLIPCIVAVAPLWNMRSNVLGGLILACVVAVVGFSIWVAIRANALPGVDSDVTPEEGWLGGILYFNPQDPALAVPRRQGFGYTLNFARPIGWVLIGAVFVIVYVSAHWLL